MKLITTEELAEKMDVDIKSVYNFERRYEDFPRAIRISKRTIRWDEEEIDEWLTKRKEAKQ